MKRYGNLYSEIIDFENILLASRKAQKGKRFRDNVLDFNYHLETELIKLQQQLKDKTYQPGAYRTFHLTNPKSRLISAAPYRDRVVHHALCNIIVPIFEKTFIHDSYANRFGFGTHRALKKFTHFARNSNRGSKSIYTKLVCSFGAWRYLAIAPTDIYFTRLVEGVEKGQANPTAGRFLDQQS